MVSGERTAIVLLHSSASSARLATRRRHCRQRATRLTLDMLGQRTLHDLGLYRSDIDAIAAPPADADRHLTWRSSW